MGATTNSKRQRTDQEKKRKHDRHKFRKTTNPTIHRKDLGNGLSGILFSCTPRHEQKCFKDAVILLDRFMPPLSNALSENQDKFKLESKEQKDEKDKNKSLSLSDELEQIRDKKQKPFTHVQGGVQGCVFVKINRDDINLEKIAEDALRDAKQTGNCSSRHCIRMLPIHTTCYAKAETASEAALEVVKNHFPSITDDENPVTYAIAFRSRMNTSASREDYITAIASAIEKYEPRYKVNLTAPQITLIVEVLKTSCCIGTFQHFFELAKMNLREAACPSNPKGSEQAKVEKPKEEHNECNNTNEQPKPDEKTVPENDSNIDKKTENDSNTPVVESAKPESSDEGKEGDSGEKQKAQTSEQ